MYEVVVLLIKPIVFLTFSLSSASLDLKVPISELTQQDGRGKTTANLVWPAWQSFCLKKTFRQTSHSFKHISLKKSKKRELVNSRQNAQIIAPSRLSHLSVLLSSSFCRPVALTHYYHHRYHHLHHYRHYHHQIVIVIIITFIVIIIILIIIICIIIGIVIRVNIVVTIVIKDFIHRKVVKDYHSTVG